MHTMKNKIFDLLCMIVEKFVICPKRKSMQKDSKPRSANTTVTGIVVHNR